MRNLCISHKRAIVRGGPPLTKDLPYTLLAKSETDSGADLRLRKQICPTLQIIHLCLNQTLINGQILLLSPPCIASLTCLLACIASFLASAVICALQVPQKSSTCGTPLWCHSMSLPHLQTQLDGIEPFPFCFWNSTLHWSQCIQTARCPGSLQHGGSNFLYCVSSICWKPGH